MNANFYTMPILYYLFDPCSLFSSRRADELELGYQNDIRYGRPVYETELTSKSYQSQIVTVMIFWLISQ